MPKPTASNTIYTLTEPFSHSSHLLNRTFNFPQCACNAIYNEHLRKDHLENLVPIKDLKIFVITGEISVSIGSNHQVMKPGGWLEIKSGTIYSLYFVEDTSLIELHMDPI